MRGIRTPNAVRTPFERRRLRSWAKELLAVIKSSTCIKTTNSTRQERSKSETARSHGRNISVNYEFHELGIYKRQKTDVTQRQIGGIGPGNHMRLLRNEDVIDLHLGKAAQPCSIHTYSNRYSPLGMAAQPGRGRP